MMKRITALFFALTISSTSFADNLLDIYQLAKDNDPQYKAAQAGYKADSESRSQAMSALLPQINASVYKSDISVDHLDPLPTGSVDYENEGYSLNLTQSLYHHDYYLALDQADAKVAQAVANLSDAEQALILRVAQNYFQVFARTEKKAISEQLQQAKQRFNVGLTAITDVHEAQARYDQAVAQDIVAENQLAISLEALRELTGKEHKQLQSLGENSPLVIPEPQDIKQWVNMAIAQNLQLKVSKLNLDIARKEVSRQRAGHYPTLDLVASKEKNDLGGGITGPTEDETTSVAIQLNVPIYSGGNTSSQTRAAAYRYQAARENHEKARRETERLARNAYLGVIANISQVKALKQALASSQIALEATQAGFEVGTRTAVDVLDSQRLLFLAKRNYAKARYDYILETLRLKQAAGLLSENDIRQINNWLE
ncbi:MAG: TolC family outer membrane protein [Calditrichaceae bacterium]